MKINELLKKRVLLFIGSMLFISGIAIITTVAINHNNDVNDKMLVDNKNLQVIYKNNDEIVEKSLKTMSFQQGINEIIPERIEILNKSDFLTEFSLCVQKLDMSNNSLDLSKIYYSVNDISGVVSDKVNNCIYEGAIEGKKKINLDVKLWIGSELVDDIDSDMDFEYRYLIK